MDDPFLTLRELLMKPPTDFIWKRMLRLFRDWPEDEIDRKEMAISYVESHQERWHPKYCAATTHEQEGHPCWSLVKHLQFGRDDRKTSVPDLLDDAPQVHSVGFDARRLREFTSIIRSTPRIDSLVLFNSSAQTDWDPLARLPQITSLVLRDCAQLEDFSFLRHVEQLESLHIVYGRYLESIGPLTRFTALRDLELLQCNYLGDLSDIDELLQLRRLMISSSRHLESIAGIEALSLLTELTLRSCSGLRELDPLEALVQLEKLDLYDCNNLRHPEGFIKLPKLAYLNVNRCASLHNRLAQNATAFNLCMRTREEVAHYQSLFGSEEHSDLFIHPPIER